MFTLKLFRRKNGQLVTKTLAVHHVETMEIGTTGRIIEVHAYRCQGDYGLHEQYFIGEREDDMDALNDQNYWGWGLLENWEGNTSEHYRPASYG